MTLVHKSRICSIIVSILVAIAMAVIMLGACMTSGCTPSSIDTTTQRAVVASNNTAAVIDALQTSALVLYRFEQERALSTAVQLDEGKAQAQARVWVVRNQWRPIWDAFDRARVAHETMATLIATMGTTAEQLASAQTKLDELLGQARALLAEARNRVEGK